jgi:peptidoglycan/xylan/chitin deacetylase (PgdA/CDA1 family)
MGIIDCLAACTPQVLYSVDTAHRALALTIDDGPDRRTTPLILEVLRRYEARATFFIITGHMPGNEALLRRMLAEGHELGNHLTRDEPSSRLSPQAFEKELCTAHAVLSAYGSRVAWCRPGSGWVNAPMLVTLQKHGYRCALGSVYPLDAQLPCPWFASLVVRWAARPGAIIILHDGGPRGRRTAKTLARVLPVLTSRGYRAVTLSELVRRGR